MSMESLVSLTSLEIADNRQRVLLAGILMGISRGAVSTTHGISEYSVDLIPVDMACNTLITAAWANSFTKTRNIPVYNCTSGQINPLKWHDFTRAICKYARKNPTKYVMLCPEFKLRTNLVVNWLNEIFLHYLPAIVFDLALRLQGKKPFLFKLAKRFKVALDNGMYFANHEWNFESKNVRRIIRAARETQNDADEFNCDISALDWDAYVESYMMGIRTYILNDDVSSLPNARKKLQRIVWTKRIFQIVFMILFYFALFHGFWR